MCKAGGWVGELHGTGLGGPEGGCDGDGVGEDGLDGLGSGWPDPSVWCFARKCLVRPPVLRKRRRQWGHGRPGGGEERVNAF